MILSLPVVSRYLQYSDAALALLCSSLGAGGSGRAAARLPPSTATGMEGPAALPAEAVLAAAPTGAATDLGVVLAADAEARESALRQVSRAAGVAV